ncbi:DUF2624 domain-containing protein [Bacillaceae bacterium CLA-AA-H227]|uniref:DUF2624 domain-containing protein n=1 Tax=Robertmurraya yapensis (ex Hitch et al 2024) TaxID=3133160 RepID=A0ACC6S8D7_9BACI
MGRLNIFQSIINHKVNTITGRDLIKYGNQFQISITKDQAETIASYLRGKNVNVFDEAERNKVIKEIAKVAGSDTAQQVNRLLLGLVK